MGWINGLSNGMTNELTNHEFVRTLCREDVGNNDPELGREIRKFMFFGGVN